MNIGNMNVTLRLTLELTGIRICRAPSRPHWYDLVLSRNCNTSHYWDPVSRIPGTLSQPLFSIPYHGNCWHKASKYRSSGLKIYLLNCLLNSNFRHKKTYLL